MLMHHQVFDNGGHYFAYNIDDFGILAAGPLDTLLYGTTKRERKAAFRKLAKLFSISMGPHYPLKEVYLGADNNGVALICFITGPETS